LLNLVAALDWAGVIVASVVNDIKPVGQGDTIAVEPDAFSLEGGKSLVDAAVVKRGRFDILVLTAGIMGIKPILDVDEAFFDQHMQFNVKAPFFIVKHALQHLGRTSLSLSLWNTFVLQRGDVSSLSHPA